VEVAVFGVLIAATQPVAVRSSVNWKSLVSLCDGTGSRERENAAFYAGRDQTSLGTGETCRTSEDFL
jgi:hypothetical protein